VKEIVRSGEKWKILKISNVASTDEISEMIRQSLQKKNTSTLRDINRILKK
jgi:2-phosphoglycerate kinase